MIPTGLNGQRRQSVYSTNNLEYNFTQLSNVIVKLLNVGFPLIWRMFTICHAKNFNKLWWMRHKQTLSCLEHKKHWMGLDHTMSLNHTQSFVKSIKSVSGSSRRSSMTDPSPKDNHPHCLWSWFIFPGGLPQTEINGGEQRSQFITACQWEELLRASHIASLCSHFSLNALPY